MALRVIFFVFLLSFAFFSLFGSRAIRYYGSTRTPVAVPTSNSLESEESIPTHYLLYVAYTPRVASTVRLVLMCTCILCARISTSNLFGVVCFLLIYYEIYTDGLSLIYWVVVYNWFCCPVCCTIYRNNISPAHQEVRDISHVLGSYLAWQLLFLCLLSNQLLVCFLHTRRAVSIRGGSSFQMRRPGLYATAPSPIVGRGR